MNLATTVVSPEARIGIVHATTALNLCGRLTDTQIDPFPGHPQILNSDQALLVFENAPATRAMCNEGKVFQNPGFVWSNNILDWTHLAELT